jgi:hypothetical protein
MHILLFVHYAALVAALPSIRPIGSTTSDKLASRFENQAQGHWRESNLHIKRGIIETNATKWNVNTSMAVRGAAQILAYSPLILMSLIQLKAGQVSQGYDDSHPPPPTFSDQPPITLNYSVTTLAKDIMDIFNSGPRNLTQWECESGAASIVQEVVDNPDRAEKEFMAQLAEEFGVLQQAAGGNMLVYFFSGGPEKSLVEAHSSLTFIADVLHPNAESCERFHKLAVMTSEDNGSPKTNIVQPQTVGRLATHSAWTDKVYPRPDQFVVTKSALLLMEITSAIGAGAYFYTASLHKLYAKSNHTEQDLEKLGLKDLPTELAKISQDVSDMLSNAPQDLDRAECEEGLLQMAEDVKDNPLIAAGLVGATLLGATGLSTLTAFTNATKLLNAFMPDDGSSVINEPVFLLKLIHINLKRLAHALRPMPGTCDRFRNRAPTLTNDQSLTDIDAAARENPSGFVLDALRFGAGLPGAMYMVHNGLEAFRNQTNGLKPATIDMSYEVLLDKKVNENGQSLQTDVQEKVKALEGVADGLLQKGMRFAYGIPVAMYNMYQDRDSGVWQDFTTKFQEFLASVIVH